MVKEPLDMLSDGAVEKKSLTIGGHAIPDERIINFLTHMCRKPARDIPVVATHQ
jgi:hypothetical protein